MAYLSKRQRISLLMMQRWDYHQKSYNEVRQIIFNETFRNGNIVISRSPWSARSGKSKKRVAWRIAKFQDDQYRRLVNKNNWNNHLSKIPTLVRAKQISNMTLVAWLCKEFWKKLRFIRIKLIWYKSWTKMILIVVWNFANSWRKNLRWPQLSFQYSFQDKAIFELNDSVTRHNCRLSLVW